MFQGNTVSLLHMNLQAANFQSRDQLCIRLHVQDERRCSAPPSSAADLAALPSPTFSTHPPAPVSNSSSRFIRFQPLYPSYCTVDYCTFQGIVL